MNFQNLAVILTSHHIPFPLAIPSSHHNQHKFRFSTRVIIIAFEIIIKVSEKLPNLIFFPLRMAANYFTRDEVVVHDSWYDIWVIINGRVFDLTNLIGKRINGLNDVSEKF